MTSLRALNPETDRDLYRQCWSWHESFPRWVQDALEAYSVETFEEYLELTKGPRSNIGVFDGENFVAMITVELVAASVYEVHLSSIRRPPREVIIEAMLNVTKTVFEDLNAKTGFSFTPDYDKGIIALVRAIGMRQDGVEKLRGVSRGKPVRWIRSIMTDADYRKLKAA